MGFRGDKDLLRFALRKKVFSVRLGLPGAVAVSGIDRDCE
jgi:hypothetical protein